MAVRWFAAESDNRARSSGLLYTLNTAGAAAGALLAGFVLIPGSESPGTTLVGVAASLSPRSVSSCDPRGQSATRKTPSPRETPVAARRSRAPARVTEPRGWRRVVLGLSGFAALVHEIAWTRVLTMVLGPTIYAFSAALAAVILGIAIGSSVGTAVVARSRRPAACGWR